MVTRRRFIEQAGYLVAAGAMPAPLRRAIPRDPVSEPRYEMRIERSWIPMRDGVRLSVTLFRPQNPAPGERFPVIFGSDPYRKDEGEAGHGRRYRYYVERGYVGAQMDVRGTGASPGRTVETEYSVQEGADCYDAIAWLARQPWCNGNVGMWGSSYGGFNSIQIAMLRPPALKAIVPMHATDDVYTDDIIYYDGALQMESLARWPLSMIPSLALPAAPGYDLETEEARYRFEAEPWTFDWLRHQHNGAYWQRMSLRPNYQAITVPTFMIGGWLDAYTDSIPRMMERMSAPTKALIGQWTHAVGQPGPAFDIDPLVLRWWDHWLKGMNNGVMEEPRLTMWVNEYYGPSVTIPEIPGSWRSEDAWPVKRVRDLAWYPQPNQVLSRERQADLVRQLEYKATVGMTNRYRCPHNAAELPVDQRPDDVQSMSFDSAPLEEGLEILGFPKVELYVAHTAPVATWVVRLCDVAPDGTSTLVTKGILNGAHRESHERPTPLEPGKVYRIPFDLKVISWKFPPGHRIRVAIGNADFANLWPSPYRMTTTLYVDAARPTRILLPVCPPETRPVPAWGPSPPREPSGSEPENQWTVTRDEMAQTVTVFRETRSARGYERRWCTASDREPAKAKLVGEAQRDVQRGSDVVSSKAWMTIESDEKAFHMTVRRQLSVNGTPKWEKSWSDVIPRRLV
jgi:uncharacterized protein